MTNEVQRETMEYDVVIIGAGPSGLSTGASFSFQFGINSSKALVSNTLPLKI